MNSPLAGYVVGAYAASAAHQTWNPELEEEFFSALESNPLIGALELPWLGSLHPHDDEWLLENFPRRFSAIVTLIPSTMSRLSADPHFGLASPNDDGRKAALIHAAQVREGVQKFNDATGRQAVRVIELHSAPRQIATKHALTQSLQEISEWDWGGAQLVVEHCDAWVAGQPPQKGFLTLTDEIQAIEESGTNIGISLNWGRSAIELRDANRVVEHVSAARESGLLQGMIFSGAAAERSALGGPWVDAHHPFQKSDLHPYGIHESLMSEQRVKDSIDNADTLQWLGVKVGWAHGDGSLRDRATMIADALNALERLRR